MAEGCTSDRRFLDTERIPGLTFSYRSPRGKVRTCRASTSTAVRHRVVHLHARTGTNSDCLQQNAADVAHRLSECFYRKTVASRITHMVYARCNSSKVSLDWTTASLCGSPALKAALGSAAPSCGTWISVACAPCECEGVASRRSSTPRKQ